MHKIPNLEVKPFRKQIAGSDKMFFLVLQGSRRCNKTQNATALLVVVVVVVVGVAITTRTRNHEQCVNYRENKA